MLREPSNITHKLPIRDFCIPEWRNDKIIPNGNYYADWTADELFIIFFDEDNNINCYILESIPKKNINSEYSKHYTWIDSSLLIPLKEISYDKNEKILKEKEFNYKQINSFHILNKIIVKNIQNNHSTKLIFDEIELNIKIKDDLFHERHLKRIPQL